MQRQNNIVILVLIFLFWGFHASAQEATVLPDVAKFKDAKTKYWINTYGNIRISKRLFWVAQTHFRFEETKTTPFAGQIAQLYNRHAIGYIYNKKLNASLGGVLRLNFNTDELSDAPRNMVPEWRIWHEYQFAVPVWNAMVYHRLRIEHRWSRGFSADPDWIFRNRWRYMFRYKQPINKPKLQSKTLYISPEAELIMQSGKAIVASPMEDLRLTTSIGYIVNPRLSVATGLMYSTGQDLMNGGNYKQSWTVRMHCYFSPDIRRVKNKLPVIHFRD